MAISCQPGRPKSPQAAEGQHDRGGGKASCERADCHRAGGADGNGGPGVGRVLNTGVERDDGQGRAEGRALGNAQRGGGGQRIVQDILHDAAGEGQGRANRDGSHHPGQPHPEDDGLRLGGSPAQDGLQNLAYRNSGGAAGRGEQHQGGQHREQDQKRKTLSSKKEIVAFQDVHAEVGIMLQVQSLHKRGRPRPSRRNRPPPRERLGFRRPFLRCRCRKTAVETAPCRHSRRPPGHTPRW